MVNFTLLIRQWFRQNKRLLPWRTTNNPYFIWLSEILLQQTRVEQGLPYYLDFTESYPTVSDLANASEQEVLRKWQGLGYYSRARNLHAAAKFIHVELNDEFPKTFKEIKKLKGVGDYTAAAISSFAFNLPHAVVDGNVFRVLSRYFNDETPIDSTQGKKVFSQYAQELIDLEEPAEHNQAIMELGALVCTPKNPNCDACPLQESCLAFKAKTINVLPAKSKKTKVKKRYFHYLVDASNNYVIEKRDFKDIWQNMYQFPLYETDFEYPRNEILHNIKDSFNVEFLNQEPLHEVKHILSHQHIYTSFWLVSFHDLPENSIQVKSEEIDDYPLPRVIDRFLEEKGSYLNEA